MSGLAAAVTLKRRGKRVLVLDANAQAGGCAYTVRRDGFLCEMGPNTMLLKHPETVEFLESAGRFASAIEAAPTARKRFVVQDGRPVALPTSPLSFVTTKVLSWPAKFRFALEPFLPRGRDPDETLADFVRRRLGADPLRELIGPLVSGVFAGDPEQLVVRHAFPKLYRLEQTYGSLIRGAIRVRGGTGPKGRMVGWTGGFSELADGLAARLGADLRLNTTVQFFTHGGSAFTLQTSAGEFSAPHLILATDAAAAAALLARHSPRAERLNRIPHAAVVVLHLGFPRTTVRHPLDGFGMLISRARGIRTLGALFSSTLFAGRCTPGQVLLTVFIGGVLDPAAIALDDAALTRIVLDDLRPLLGIQSPPVLQQVVRWPKAIPQYGKDHEETLEACDAVEKSRPGLHLIGNYRGGISLADCLANGFTLGMRLSS